MSVLFTVTIYAIRVGVDSHTHGLSNHVSASAAPCCPCHAGITGGAGVYAEGIGKGGMYINRSNFTYNTAEIGGGAVYLRFFAFLVVDSSR